MTGGIEDRHQRLDAAIEIARHQIGGRNVDMRLCMRQAVTAAKRIDARMFEEATDDGFDADIFR